MIFRLVFIFTMVGCISSAQAQIQLERAVLSPFGMHVDGGAIQSAATAGQVEFVTFESNGYYLTQGFHQPRNRSTLQVSIQVYASECKEEYDVRILSITGCADMSGVQIIWNGVTGGMMQRGLPATTSLTITTASGCEYTALLSLSNYPNLEVLSCDLEFFNYISPNQDGDNDVWMIRNIEGYSGKSIEVKIVNRWGNCVWQGVQYDNENVVWAGTTQQGEPLPDGTYYYYVTIDETVYNGYIELIR